MPESRQKSQEELDIQNEDIKKAIDEKKRDPNLSFRELARRLDIRESTFRQQFHGRPTKRESSKDRQKLNPHEEESLVKWILYLESIGLPPQYPQVRNMANFILACRGMALFSPVGRNWIPNFLKRQNKVRSKLVKARDVLRAKSETPEKFNDWFQCVKKTMDDYGILETDVYNFDETGFAMGVLGTTRIITGAEVRDETTLLQSGNRQWVTAIECISAGGFALSPMIIFRGTWLVDNWSEGLEKSWHLAVSENGWTNNKLAFSWLKNVFHPQTNARRQGKYRLLLCDGHGSHFTPEFIDFCHEKNILVRCMPPHASHRLQPLDLICFSVLKKQYRNIVQRKMQIVHTVDKFEFLAAYTEARKFAFTALLIASAFKTSGLFPFDPVRVIDKLPRQFLSPTQIDEGLESRSPEDIFFPCEYEEIVELEREFARHIRSVDHGPKSPIKKVMVKLSNKVHCAIQRGNIFQEQMRQKDQKFTELTKKKNRPKRKYIKESDLSVEEIELRKNPSSEVLETNGLITEEMIHNGSPVRKKKQRLCGKCRKPGHKVQTCSMKKQ